MSTESTDHSTQTIEELSERYKKLNEQKIQAGTNLDNAQKQLNELKKKAKREYGTDDLGELKKKLEEMKRKNEEDRANYQESLDKIEAELLDIDNKYSSVESAND